MILLNGEEINKTVFPDRTTQVWKLDNFIEDDENSVEWEYENDGEIFHLLQLLDLLHTECHPIKLFIPYMPYARQDKLIDNEATFALYSLMSLLSKYCPELEITTVDVHSDIARMVWVHGGIRDAYYGDPTYSELINQKFTNIYPASLVDVVNKYDVVIFPDKGALDRYGNVFSAETKYSMSKVRDQLTGEILGMEFNEKDINLKNKSVVIVDDICDGGRTFVGVADAIDTMNLGQTKLSLCVTHGIFSNLSILDSMLGRYFNRIYTTDSLYRDMNYTDWLEASQQSVKYKILRGAIINHKLVILDCSRGENLEL